jgi:hypothetical protein
MPNSGKSWILQISKPGGDLTVAAASRGRTTILMPWKRLFCFPELWKTLSIESAKHQSPDGLGFAFGGRLFSELTY